MKRTILFNRHEQLGARMAPFGGFLMPIQYEGILAEHQAARIDTAIFDTCHMGEFRLSGRTACTDLENLVSCDLAALAVGRCRYGLMCNPEGGVVDDLLLYRLDAAEFMIVVNAGTQDEDFRWIASHVSESTKFENISGSTAKVDVQGPGSPRIVQSLVDDPINDLKYFGFHHNTFKGMPVLISRTGYTGEVGFEIYSEKSLAEILWDACVEKGAVPAGLGARDTLRLEMGLPLYGRELKRDRNAGAAGFERFISKTKDFIGSSAVRSGDGLSECLVGLAMEGRQAAREGNRIRSEEGSVIGMVTSGSFAPSLGCAVALGYVDSDFSAEGTSIVIEARRALKGRIVSLPFYRHGTARKPVSEFL